MKKSILNIGDALSKQEQKEIRGGVIGLSDGECTPSGAFCMYQGFLGNDCPDPDELCDLFTNTCYCPEP